MKKIVCAGCDKFIMELPESEAEFISAMCLDCFQRSWSVMIGHDWSAEGVGQIDIKYN